VSGPFLPEARIYSGDREGHRLGIRSLGVRVDGVLTYRFLLESFRFSQYPQVGLLLDHALSRVSPPEYVYILSRRKGNDLGGVPTEEIPWPPLGAGDHRLEVEAWGPLGAISRAAVAFRVLPPVRLRWEGDPSPGSRRTLRFGAQRDELGPALRVSYRALGRGTGVDCEGREELPDGEICGFSLRSGAAGITAELYQGSGLLGRSTWFLPGDSEAPPVVPRIRVEPSRHFVDLHLLLEKGGIPPASLVLRQGSESNRLALVEVSQEELLGTVPAEVWKAARSVGLDWEASSRGAQETKALATHFASVESGLFLEDCGARLQIGPGSLYEDTPATCENPGSFPAPGEEMALLGSPVRLLPEGTPLSRPGSLTFPSPVGPHPERMGIYRLEPVHQEWRFEGGERVEEGIQIPVRRLDTFALLRDDSPPRILEVDPSSPATAPSARPLLRVRVTDRGSGLNYDGVHLLLDGRELETEYDPDRGWSTAAPAEALSPGRHEGKVWAVDRAGNRSADQLFEVIVR
jgi:hypothetical protein